MTYIPKSKIIVKTAQYSYLEENFYSNLSPNKPYTGPYMETSEGRYFIGTDFRTKGAELFKKSETSVNFGTGEDFNTYLNIKPSPYKFLDKTKPIPATKKIPTEKDYERGYYKRYFSSRVNQQFGYKEISFKTYNSIDQQQGEYDHHLHDVGLINWAIKGNVYKINQLTLIEKQKSLTNISHLFPILNEFQRPDLQLQTDLTTEGEELYYADGTEYIGSYHIHPTEGPMEGAKHILTSHSKLYYSDNLPIPARDTSVDEEYKQYLEEEKKKANRIRKNNIINRPTATRDQTRTTPSRTNTPPPTTTPSRGSTSSPVGGSGY